MQRKLYSCTSFEIQNTHLEAEMWLKLQNDINLILRYIKDIDSYKTLIYASVRQYFDPIIYWPQGQYIIWHFHPGVNLL